MEKKRLLTILSVALLVSFTMFIVATQISEVPLWWIFSGLKLLSTSPQLPKLVAKVSPETPLSIGERVTVTVTNSSSQSPVEGAEVSVIKDGMNISLKTDSNGQAFFEYFGEVSVVSAHKNGIDPSDPIAIPKMPDKWVRDTFGSLAIGVISGIVSGGTAYMLQRRKGHPEPSKGQTKRKRTPRR